MRCAVLALVVLACVLSVVQGRILDRVTTTTTKAQHDIGVSFYREFDQKSGEPFQRGGGGEEWTFEGDSVITNMWGGLVIGNIAKGSNIMCERYIYARDKHEEATYCYGFLLSGEVQFGGWEGENSCAWYPLQRDFNHFISTRATKVSQHPYHKPRCEFDNNTGHLSLKSIMNPRGYINGHDGLPILKQMKTKLGGCKLYVNFDKTLQQFIGNPIGELTAGQYLYRRYIVEGQFEKAALVQVDKRLITPATSRWQGWFFVDSSCLEDLLNGKRF